MNASPCHRVMHGAGSLNVIHGLVGLDFSCDGSQHVDHADFLAHAEQMYATGAEACTLPSTAGT